MNTLRPFKSNPGVRGTPKHSKSESARSGQALIATGGNAGRTGTIGAERNLCVGGKE